MSSHTMEVDNDWLSHFILTTYPIIIAQGIILLEVLRILPAEVRMWIRAFKRKRPNAAESMFITIKTFAIIGYVSSAVVRSTKFPQSAWQCRATDTVGYVFTLLATSAVAATIAWRCYIIFQCSRKVYWILMAALSVQVSLAMWVAFNQLKTNVLTDGWCDIDYSAEVMATPMYKRATPYYLAYNIAFDLSISIISGYHLVKSSGASFGLSKISRVLFCNNIHYVLIVCSANSTEFVWMQALATLPSLTPLTCALQIITGMNIVAIEQDLVHQPITTRVSHAPNSPGKGDTSRSSASRDGQVLVTPSSSLTSGNWQTNSKEIVSFQTETSSSTSPILQSMWNKHTRKHSQQHSRSMSSNKTPGITYEQKKMHFYDDVMTDVEKNGYDENLGWDTGSPQKKGSYTEEGSTFIIANPDNDEQQTQIIQVPSLNTLTPTKSPYQTGHPSNRSNVSLSSPASMSLKRDDSVNSSRVHFRNNYPGIKDSSTPVKRTNDGVSIRSIRANMDSTAASASFDQNDAPSPIPFKPLKYLPKISSGPSPITPPRRLVHKQSNDSPTFEISPGSCVTIQPRPYYTKSSSTSPVVSPSPFTTSHLSMSPPAAPPQLQPRIITKQSSKNSLLSNDGGSVAPLRLIRSQNSIYQDCVNANSSSTLHSPPPPLRKRSNYPSTVLEMDGTGSDVFESHSNNQSSSSSDDVGSSTTFGCNQGHLVGGNAFDMVHDPFRH